MLFLLSIFSMFLAGLGNILVVFLISSYTPLIKSTVNALGIKIVPSFILK